MLTSVVYKLATYTFSGSDPVVIHLTDAGGNATGATVTVSSNGAYTVDATNADALGAGQSVGFFDITYQVKQTVLESDGSIAGTATATAHLTGSVVGVNDGVGAVTDNNGAANAVTENAAIGTTVGITASRPTPMRPTR